MPRIQRFSVCVAAHAQHGAALFAPLDDIVAGRAQALPVLGVPEKLHVTLVRDDVINDGRRCRAAGALAVHAQRMRGQEDQRVPWQGKL